MNEKKVIFPSIFDMVGSKVIQNSVHLQKKCSILSPNDKMTKNASNNEFTKQDFK